MARNFTAVDLQLVVVAEVLASLPPKLALIFERRFVLIAVVDSKAECVAVAVAESERFGGVGLVSAVVDVALPVVAEPVDVYPCTFAVFSPG